MKFDYINNEKVDLSRQDHRDEIIRRNKALELAVKEGLDPKKVRVEVIIDIELDCLKYGNPISNRKVEQLDDYGYGDFLVENKIPVAKCEKCDTKYIYDDTNGNFVVFLKKEDLKLKKLSNDAEF